MVNWVTFTFFSKLFISASFKLIYILQLSQFICYSKNICKTLPELINFSTESLDGFKVIVIFLSIQATMELFAYNPKLTLLMKTVWTVNDLLC